jgi:hypothetical protein
MNIFDFEHPEFGIKGVTQYEVESLRKFCDINGKVPYFGAKITHFKYDRQFTQEEWDEHTKSCDNLVRQILERVKFLPDKIDHFDWWEMD